MPTTGPDHVRLGVGARFTLSPAIDDAVPVILGALAAAAHAARACGAEAGQALYVAMLTAT